MKASKLKILEKFLSEHPESAAEVFLWADAEEISRVFRELSAKTLAESVKFLPTNLATQSLLEIENEKLVEVLVSLPPNLASNYIRQMRSSGHDRERVNRLVEALPPSFAGTMKKTLEFGDGTVGSLMHPVPFTVLPHFTVSDAIDLLSVSKSRYNRYLYVQEESGKLLGVLPFKDLFYADKNESISKRMIKDVRALEANDMVTSKLIDELSGRWSSLPVVDLKDQLIGIANMETLTNYASMNDSGDLASTNDVRKAGQAIGEVFLVGLNAVASTVTMDERRR